MSRLVDVASLAAVALAAHTAVNARLLRRPPPATPAHGRGTLPAQPARRVRPARVSVLVPARDEAHRIGPCVAALLASRGVDLELLVLDDGSTDGTAWVVRSVAAGDPRLRMLPGASLPPGWLGKPHACAQLAAAATGTVLVFVDADVVVAPDALARTVALLDAAGLALVSPYPRQLTGSLAERLVQPLLQWSWLTFLPLRLAETSPRASLAAANGRLLACHADAYRAAGGHTGVRQEVVEDVALARAFKRAGLRATVADGTDLATCRMYDGWSELRDGYTKSLWAAFGSPAGAASVVALLVALYVVPPLATVGALARRRPAARAAGAGLARRDDRAGGRGATDRWPGRRRRRPSGLRRAARRPDAAQRAAPARRTAHVEGARPLPGVRGAGSASSVRAAAGPRPPRGWPRSATT